MDIKPIRTDADYEAAMQEIDRLFGQRPARQRATSWMYCWRSSRYMRRGISSCPCPIPSRLSSFMERLGLSRRDLEPYLAAARAWPRTLNPQAPADTADDPQAGGGAGDTGGGAGASVYARQCSRAHDAVR